MVIKMRKRICSVICALSIAAGLFGSFTSAHADTTAQKFNYKFSMESDSDFSNVYGYSSGTSQKPNAQPKIGKTYVAGACGKAVKITYPGFLITGDKYNGYVFNLKEDDITAGFETMSMLDLMRDTKNISMYVHTPVTVDHGNGAAANRVLEMIFEVATETGSRSFSKKFQIPNTGEWAYITIPTSEFKAGSLNMASAIQSDEYTSLKAMKFSFPYKDYFGANPDEATWETPWEEPLMVDEILFDRSTEDEPAVNPASTGGEAYHENANIKTVLVDGRPVDGFDKNSSANTIPVPEYVTPENMSEHITVEVEAPDIKKTNVSQKISGATYSLNLPQSIPGTGSITVTSASTKSRKTYNVSFTRSSGVKVIPNGITGGDLSVGDNSVKVPIVNESLSADVSVDAILAVKNSATGECVAVSYIQNKSIAAASTAELDFSVSVPTSGCIGEIYIFDSQESLKMIDTPFVLPYMPMDYTAGNGTLREFYANTEGNMLSVGGSLTEANDGDDAVIMIKNNVQIIGMYTANIQNNSFLTQIKMTDQFQGDITVVVGCGGKTMSKNLYNASDKEAEECINIYRTLGGDDNEIIGFLDEYSKILNISAELLDMLTKSECVSVVKAADKSLSTVSEISKEISSGLVLFSMNKYNSADILKTLYQSYNNILKFDNTTGCFKEYIKDGTALDKVISRVARDDYTSLDDARAAFNDSVIIYAVNNVVNYSVIGTLLKDNAALIGSKLDYSILNSLSESQKSGFYILVAERKGIDGFDELNKILKEYKESVESGENNTQGQGSNSGGSVIATDPGALTEKEENTLNHTNFFEDVDSSHWAYTSIQALRALGIISGKADNIFGVNENITREEFVKILMGVFNIKTEECENVFDDVDSEMWYAPYILTAYKLGIASGISDRSFGVGQLITRQDMAALTARAMEYSGMILDSSEENKFSDDSEIGDYAKKSVYALKKLGLISGMDDGSYAPTNSATRAQAAKMLYSVYGYISSSDAAEEAEGYSRLADKLERLGIIKERIGINSNVSRGLFSKYIADFMNRSEYKYSGDKVIYADVPTSYKYYDDIMFLYDSNIVIGSEGVFRPYDAITYGEAAQMLVKALGYGVYAAEGTTPEGYLTLAQQKGIIKNISKTAYDLIPFNGVLELFDKAKDTYVVRAELSNPSKSSIVITDVTALYHYHKISTIKGILRAVGSRSMDNGGGTNKDNVKIDNAVFSYNDSSAYEYLGYQVRGYCHEDESEMLYVEPYRSSDILEVDGRSINNYENSRLSYYKAEDSNSLKSIDVEKSASILYNYNFNTKIQDEDFKNAEKIIFVDNDNDGSYDVVNIINEETYFVSQISAADGTIYDDDSQTPIKIDEQNNTYLVFDEKGKSVSVKSVLKNDVLSVIKDKQGENYILHISKKSAEGVVTLKDMSTDKRRISVVIANTKYYIAPNIMDSPAAMDYLSPGSGVTIYLNKNNEIAHVVYNSRYSDYRYGYVIRAVPETNTEDALIKLYSDDGKISILNAAQKMTLNGKQTELSKLDVNLKECNVNKNSVKMLVRYRLGTDGKISALYTADQVDDTDFYNSTSSFMRYKDLEDIYYYQNYSAYVGTVRVNEETMIMTVPESDSLENDESYYAITKYVDFKSSSNRRVEVYNLSQDKTAGIIVIHSNTAGGTELTYSTPVMVVKSVSQELVGDDIRERITVLYNGAEHEYLMADGCGLSKSYKGAGGAEVVSTVEKGDMIRGAVNGNNEIYDYQKVFDMSDTDDPTVVYRGNEYMSRNTYLGSEKNMISFLGNADNVETDIRVGRIWHGKSPSWFTGVKFSMEFGIVSEIHDNTIVANTYGGTVGSNSTKCARFISLKNRRVYVIDDVNDEVRIGSTNDIVSVQNAGEKDASRIVCVRHDDVPSFVAVIIRKD